VCRESPEFLDGYQEAVRHARGRVLCVVVVNGAVDSDGATREANRTLLRGLRARFASVSRVPGPFSMELGSTAGLDVLLVDRASPGRELPAKQGVGLARKIGLDVALALRRRGRAGPIAHTTDADATLPDDYFGATALVEASHASAAVYPFRHVPCGDDAVDERTAQYELFLRYWVAGLSFAGSPYAFHTVGSAIAVSLVHYARVRGVPRRQAGEDFYLLNKLAKVAPVVRLTTSAIHVASRYSDRTPFGTGRAVERLARQEFRLPDARCFESLLRVTTSLDDLATHGDTDRYCAAVRSSGHSEADELIAGARAVDGLGRVCTGATRCADRRARLHGWFDAFRTMRFVRLLGNRAFPSAPWQQALAQAKFVPGEPSRVSEALDALAAREAAAPALVGPSVHCG
jgi:hypothetical protein